MLHKEYIDPNEGFTQTVVVTSGTIKTLYISGQIGTGDDLEHQTIATFLNLEKQLAKAKANFSDVVKMTTFIVNFNPERDLPIYRKVRQSFLDKDKYPSSSVVGVSALGNKEWLIEIEAIAVVSI